MYITTVDSASFQELKQEQSLHVTFSGFKENLIQILQDCKLGKLEICLVQDSRINESNAPAAVPAYKLQFVEIRAFKNLVHLSLPCQLASLNVILFYMNSILEKLQVGQRIVCSFFLMNSLIYTLFRESVLIMKTGHSSCSMRIIIT